MTNEEAREQLKLMKAFIGYDAENPLVKKMQSALDHAIKALEQEPGEDCISRSGALDTLKTSFLGMSFERYKKAKRMFEQLSSVTPQRPEGRWIATENEEMNIDGYYCSCCDLPMETEERTEYCPNCGAKMKAESEDKE